MDPKINIWNIYTFMFYIKWFTCISILMFILYAPMLQDITLVIIYVCHLLHRRSMSKYQHTNYFEYYQ